jgi:hypothetical protein
LSLYPVGGSDATAPPDHTATACACERGGDVNTPAPEPGPAWLGPGAGLPAGVVAVRVSDLAATATPGGPGALVPRGGGGGPLVAGEMVAWCKVVTHAPVVVNPDGRVTVGGWLPDHVQLGILEQHIGDGVIEKVVAAEGLKPNERNRLMSLALTARFVLAMTLSPTSYVDVMAQLAGLLPLLPWQQGWHVPSSTVFTEWRRRLGDKAMEALFWLVAGLIVTDDDARWHGLWVGGVDGFQCRMPDTPANRAAFGTKKKKNRTPFPLLRCVLVTARAGRAILAAEIGGSSVGEQTLTWRLVKKHRSLFGAGRVYLFDRNFLGFDLINEIHGCGAHLVMRVKSDIRLHRFKSLPDGSYLAYLYSPDGKRRMVVRVVEYDVRLPDGTVSELYCLATTLLDHKKYPADDVSDLYKQRWSACETTIGENKSAITDAGPSRGPILRSEEPALVLQEMWAWLTASQLVRMAAHAVTQATTGVSTDQVSFTTMRREALRSMTQTMVTATTPASALAAAAEHAARAALANLVTTDRDRHSAREQKCGPSFKHTNTTTPTTRGPFEVNLNNPPALADIP